MAQEQAEVKSIPPYVPYKTFKSFLDGLRVAMPSRIDRSLMGTMSGATQGQLLSALRFLDLITDNGAPTSRLKELAKSEGKARKELLGDVMTDAYVAANVFAEGVIDIDTGTYRQLHEAFARTGAQGDTVRKCIAFWLLAMKDAEVLVSPHFSVRGSRGPSRSPTKRRRVERDADMDDDLPPAPRQPSGPRTPFEILMEKFPAFDPSWDSEVQAKWFDAFSRLRSMGAGADEASE